MKPNNIWFVCGLIIIVLVFYIFYIKGCNGNNNTKTIVTTTDTFYVPSVPYKVTDTFTIPSKEKVVTIIPDSYIPKKSYDSLLYQYNSLVKDYLTERLYRDSSFFDSSKLIYDGLVQDNKLKSINFEFYPKTKIITNNITEYKKYRTLFFDAGLDGIWNKQNYGFGINVGLSYKDKQDRIYSGFISANTFGYYTVGFNRSFKLSK